MLDRLCGREVNLGLDRAGTIRVLDYEGLLLAENQLKPAAESWQKIPGHHAGL